MENILITTTSFNNNNIEFICKKGFNVIVNSLGRKLTEEEALKFTVEAQPVGIIAGLEP